MTDSELIDEGSRLAGRLASLDEGQLTGIAMLLVSAALAVFAVLLARQGMAAVRGEAAPHGSFRG